MRKLPVLAVLILGSFLLLGKVAAPVVLPSDIRFLSGILSPFEDEVPGRELVMGGCGNAPILMVLRTVLIDEGMLEALPAAEPARGISGVDAVPPGVGSADGRDGAFRREGVCGRLLRGPLG